MLALLKSVADRVRPGQKGQDLAEYAMLIGLIALAVVAAVTLLGGSLTGVYTAIAGLIGPWIP
jgi:pilus assembly protein Flp/PilA